MTDSTPASVPPPEPRSVPASAAPLYDETRCHAERHIGPAGAKVVVWCDKDKGHKGQHRNEQQGIYWSGNDA